MLATVTTLQAILSQHRGKRNAIQVRALAEKLETDQRRVRMLKRELAEFMLIGSSCDAKSPGYYVPETAAEIDETIANYYARIRALAALIRATKGAAEAASFFKQLHLEFQGGNHDNMS